MLNTLFATKKDMSQVWTIQGKRLVATCLEVADNVIVSQAKIKATDRTSHNRSAQDCQLFEIGYGQKKLKNCTKPLQEKIKKSGYLFGLRQLKGVKIFGTADNADATLPKVGQLTQLTDLLTVGDVVKVQGRTKGKGFAGVVKRHGFKGGPHTHGQSDRERAPGSIGCRTTPGRVWRGQRMAGRMGGVLNSVTNLVVLHIDPTKKLLWVSGPVPGAKEGIVRIIKTEQHKKIELNYQASGLKVEAKDEVKTAAPATAPADTKETTEK